MYLSEDDSGIASEEDQGVSVEDILCPYIKDIAGRLQVMRAKLFCKEINGIYHYTYHCRCVSDVPPSPKTSAASLVTARSPSPVRKQRNNTSSGSSVTSKKRSSVSSYRSSRPSVASEKRSSTTTGRSPSSDVRSAQSWLLEPDNVSFSSSMRTKPIVVKFTLLTTNYQGELRLNSELKFHRNTLLRDIIWVFHQKNLSRIQGTFTPRLALVEEGRSRPLTLADMGMSLGELCSDYDEGVEIVVDNV